MIGLEVVLNLFNFGLIVVAFIIVLSIIRKTNVSSLKILSFTLSMFLGVHGLYHILEAVDIEPYIFIGESILKPFSYFLLLSFLIYLYLESG